MNYIIADTHISNILIGDTIIHEDKMVTITRSNIKHDNFIGTTIFGDNYNLGNILVKKVIFIKK